MTYKDICTKRTYIKDGIEKAVWMTVGTLRVTPEGKEFIELNMFPNTPFYVFQKESKVVTPEKRAVNDAVAEKLFDTPLSEEEHINLEDIPF